LPATIARDADGKVTNTIVFTSGGALAEVKAKTYILGKELSNVGDDHVGSPDQLRECSGQRRRFRLRHRQSGRIVRTSECHVFEAAGEGISIEHRHFTAHRRTHPVDQAFTVLEWPGCRCATSSPANAAMRCAPASQISTWM
jgi:hypothetical protein